VLPPPLLGSVCGVSQSVSSPTHSRRAAPVACEYNEVVSEEKAWEECGWVPLLPVLGSVCGVSQSVSSPTHSRRAAPVACEYNGLVSE
jgi:hypothetical protein